MFHPRKDPVSAFVIVVTLVLVEGESRELVLGSMSASYTVQNHSLREKTRKEDFDTGQE